jgi:hypothetical protein
MKADTGKKTQDQQALIFIMRKDPSRKQA